MHASCLFRSFVKSWNLTFTMEKFPNGNWQPSAEEIDNAFVSCARQLLEERAAIDDKSQCWVWGGVIFRTDQTKIKKKTVRIRYLAYMIQHRQPVPAGTTLILRNDCSPKCCNPEHVRAKLTGWSTIDDDFCADARSYLQERSKVKPDTNCWLWNLAVDQSGYAISSFRGKSIYGHILAVVTVNRALVEKGLVAAHGNGCPRACVNPEHITSKTYQENSFADRVRDGTSVRGETHPHAKITTDLAREIKSSKGKGGTSAERASTFGVSLSIVRAIDGGHSWGWLDNPNYFPRAPKSPKPFELYDRKKVLELLRDGSKETPLSENIHPELPAGTNCWLWGKSLFRGYGRICCNGRKHFCHVLADFCATGSYSNFEKGEQIRHLCGNSSCCNPVHLLKGTSREQALDRKIHGTARVGSQNRLSKLDEEKVRSIRQLSIAGTKRRLIAERFGVTVESIRDIVNGHSWIHVT